MGLGGEDGEFFFASGEQYNVISTELMSNILWNLHLKISKKPYLQESSIQLKSKTTYNQIDQVELCFLYHLLAKQLMQICIFIFFGHSVFFLGILFQLRLTAWFLLPRLHLVTGLVP